MITDFTITTGAIIIGGITLAIDFGMNKWIYGNKKYKMNLISLVWAGCFSVAATAIVHQAFIIVVENLPAINAVMP